MKADRIILVLVVVIMLASVVGSYFLFLQQDSMSGKKIDAVKLDVDNLSAALKQVDSQLKEFQLKGQDGVEAVKRLEEKINAAEADRMDINAKINDLMQSVEMLKKGASAPAPVEEAVIEPEKPQEEAVTSNVDLGQIPVEK